MGKTGEFQGQDSKLPKSQNGNSGVGKKRRGIQSSRFLSLRRWMILTARHFEFATFGWRSGNSFCILVFMETVDCQGFQLSPYAAELAEREGIDVGLIKRNLDLSPRERIEQSQQAANFVKQLREAGERMRHEK